MNTHYLYLNSIYRGNVKFVENTEVRNCLMKIKDDLMEVKPIYLLDEGLLIYLLELMNNKYIDRDTKRIIKDIIDLLKERKVCW